MNWCEQSTLELRIRRFQVQLLAGAPIKSGVTDISRFGASVFSDRLLSILGETALESATFTSLFVGRLFQNSWIAELSTSRAECRLQIVSLLPMS